MPTVCDLSCSERLTLAAGQRMILKGSKSRCRETSEERRALWFRQEAMLT